MFFFFFFIHKPLVIIGQKKILFYLCTTLTRYLKKNLVFQIRMCFPHTYVNYIIRHVVRVKTSKEDYIDQKLNIVSSYQKVLMPPEKITFRGVKKCLKGIVIFWYYNVCFKYYGGKAALRENKNKYFYSVNNFSIWIRILFTRIILKLT